MRIAYLISGHPKTYEECVSTFLRNVPLEKTEVYSHFWWDESYKKKCWKMHFKEKIGEDDSPEKIVEKFGIKKCYVEKSKMFDLTFFKRFNRNTWGENSEEFYKVMTPVFLYGILSQTFSIWQSFLLSQESQYDIVIKSRPDIILSKELYPEIEKLRFSENDIFFQSSMNGGHLYAGEFPNKPCDWFFMGSAVAMKKFLEGWHNSISQNFTEGIMHTNELVKYVCDICGLSLNLVDFGAHIYKQATNYYEIHHNKIEVYLEDFDFLKSIPNTPSIWPYWVDKVNFDHFKNIKF